jgi:hypothetical protein
MAVSLSNLCDVLIFFHKILAKFGSRTLLLYDLSLARIMRIVSSKTKQTCFTLYLSRYQFTWTTDIFFYVCDKFKQKNHLSKENMVNNAFSDSYSKVGSEILV